MVDDVELTRAVAGAMAADMVAAGINLDFAPVADVNTTADNAIIGVRSFGSDAELVARHVAAFVEGLETGGVAACAKHFAGHGDTLQDSHLELPTVDTLRPEALLPFRAAIDAGVTAIMSAHIRVREIGDEPATLSPALLTDLLRGELRFAGVAITDALEMKAISATWVWSREQSEHWPRAPTPSAWDMTSAPTRWSELSLLWSKACRRSA